MAAVTTEYYEFTGPGFLTLLRNKTLVGKAYIQYQDTAGKWSRLYDADGEPVVIGWPAETVPVDVPDGTLWRAVASYFDCDENSVEFAFYNADLGNQPVVDLPEYNGSPIRCDNKAYRGGYTTYFQKFDGSGVLGLVDPGKLASPAWVNLLLSENPDRSAPYHIDGERAELGTGVESIEIKHAGPVLVGYQVANCFVDDVVFSMTPVDYTGGFAPPNEAPVFDGVVPDMSLVEDTPMTPFSFDQHFLTGGVVDTYSVTLLPNGLVLDPVTGVLSGTPIGSGSFNPIVTGTNSFGSDDTNVFSIDVSSNPTPPAAAAASKKKAKKKAKRKVKK